MRCTLPPLHCYLRSPGLVHQEFEGEEGEAEVVVAVAEVVVEGDIPFLCAYSGCSKKAKEEISKARERKCHARFAHSALMLN